jgi:uncharacterized protein (TIGR03067 family)
MRLLATMLAWLALAPTVSLAAPALKDKKDQDGTRILGFWISDALSLQGNPPQGGSDYTFRFGTDGTCGIANGGGKEIGAQFTLDPSTTPHRMKWLNGPQLTEWLCLYELDGDTLKVVFVDAGTEAPQKIEPAKNLTIYYLKRQKN